MIINNNLSNYISIYDCISPEDIVVKRRHSLTYYEEHLNNKIVYFDEINNYVGESLVVLIDINNISEKGNEDLSLKVKHPERYKNVLYLILRTREVLIDRISKNICALLIKKGYHKLNHHLLACVPFGDTCWVDDRINVSKSNFFYDLYNSFKVHRIDQTIEHKDFLYYMGKPKHERMLLLSLLHEAGIVNKGHISAFSSISWIGYSLSFDFSDFDAFTKSLQNREQVVEKTFLKLQKIKNKFPFIITEKEYTREKTHNCHIVKEHFDKTSFSLINETCPMMSDQHGFLTEKTFKAVRMNHPFYILTHPNMGEIIKEIIPPCKHHLLLDIDKYDHIINVVERSEKIVQLMKERIKKSHVTLYTDSK